MYYYVSSMSVCSRMWEQTGHFLSTPRSAGYLHPLRLDLFTQSEGSSNSSYPLTLQMVVGMQPLHYKLNDLLYNKFASKKFFFLNIFFQA